MEVGRVKSENDEFTEVAVARQRALIAEVSFLTAILMTFIHDNMYLIVYYTKSRYNLMKSARQETLSCPGNPVLHEPVVSPLLHPRMLTYQFPSSFSLQNKCEQLRHLDTTQCRPRMGLRHAKGR